jgi:hypothetical protein
MEDICPKPITVDRSTKAYSTYPVLLHEGRRLAPAAQRVAQKIYPACVDYYSRMLVAIALRMRLRPYLADAIRNETESRTPLIIESRVLKRSLVAVATCGSYNKLDIRHRIMDIGKFLWYYACS